MRKYDEALVDQIHQSDEVISAYGTEIHLKKSPTRKGKGYFDPFEMAIMEQNWAASKDGDNIFEQDLSVEEMILFLRDTMGFPNLNLNMQEMVTKFEIVEAAGHPVGLRRYYLRHGSKEAKSCLIYIHGGGWIGGTVDCVENPCKLICELSDSVVFNVDYDLAPEVKFPGNVDECCAIVRHVYEHADEYGVDRKRITVAGDSAGGNLAAAVCLKDRDEGTHFVSQEILLYPAVTFGENAAPGYEWRDDAYEIAPEQEVAIRSSLILGRPKKLEGDMEAESYFSDVADASSPYASPMMAESHAGLPRTIIMTAEFDGLRQQGEFYGSQLAKAGVDTTIYRYCGCSHAFLDRLGYIPQTEEACKTIAEALRN